MRAEIQLEGCTLIVENALTNSKEELINAVINAQSKACGNPELFFDLSQWKLALEGDASISFVWGMFNKTITIG
jgi:hypothetical protein